MVCGVWCVCGGGGGAGGGGGSMVFFPGRGGGEVSAIFMDFFFCSDMENIFYKNTIATPLNICVIVNKNLNLYLKCFALSID